MEKISPRDLTLLRGLAAKQAEYALSPKNLDVLKKWESLAKGERKFPIVRLLPGNFLGEVISPQQRCEGEFARGVEFELLRTMTGINLFSDDTPISGTFDIGWRTWVSPYGARAKTTPNNGRMGYHIDPVIEDLESDFDLLRGGGFGVDKDGTLKYFEAIYELFHDILPPRMTMGSLSGAMTGPLVHLTGLETLYYSLYDYPEKVHEAMEMACSLYEKYYDFLERERLLLPTMGTSPVAQESFAYNDELPTEDVTSTAQCWGFLESQETTAVSPELFGEFVFPYQDRLVKRFGLLSYGCCERIDAIYENYLAKWDKLRKLSVSPFNNEEQVGEFLRGSNIVYYSKPRAEFLTNPGPLDESGIRGCFKAIALAARGCILEVAQREAGTIYGDPERGRNYVRIAKEAIEEHWQP